MLRITRKAKGEVVFRVSGQLTAENVSEMERLITAETKGRRIVLDCTDLRSVDGEVGRDGPRTTLKCEHLGILNRCETLDWDIWVR